MRYHHKPWHELGDRIGSGLVRLLPQPKNCDRHNAMRMEAQDVQLGRVKIALLDDGPTKIATYCLAHVVYERAVFPYVLDLAASCDLRSAFVRETHIQKVRDGDLQPCNA